MLYTVSPMHGLYRMYDLDGTVVDTNGSHVAATQSAFADFKLEMPEDFRQRNSEGVRLRDILKEMGVAAPDILRVRETRDRYHIEWLKEYAVWLEGAEEVLARQRAARQQIAIITNSTDDFVDAIHARLGVRSKTDFIVTTTTPGIEKGKPDPAGIQLALRTFDLSPEECMFVGDQGFDVEAAHRARMQSCLIRGPHTINVGEAPHYEIGHVRELLN